MCGPGPRWATENASGLCTDPARLAVAGDGAGRNLAAVAAALLRDDDRVTVRRQLLIYPSTTCDLDREHPNIHSVTAGLTDPVLAISFGAGLGILIPRARRSLKRGVGHLATLVVYAAGSAAAVVVSMMLFGALDQPWAKQGCRRWAFASSSDELANFRGVGLGPRPSICGNTNHIQWPVL